MKNTRFMFSLASILILELCFNVGADIGVPMIAIYLPPAWLSLIPIILIEATVGIRVFGLPRKDCYIATSIANVVTTIIGIPITWFVLALLEGIVAGGAYGLYSLPRRIFAVTVQSPWLIPYESELRWMVPIAAIFLTVPMYLMSVYIESFVVKRFMPTIDNRVIRKWMWQANALSYLLIVLIIAVSMPFERLLGGIYRIFYPIASFMVEGIFRIAHALK